MATSNHYSTLGVKRNATQDEIKKSYRRLAKKFHPDISKETNAESHFKRITEAYKILKNKEKRTNYDLFGSSVESTPQTNNDFAGFDPSIFGDFFKQAAPVQKKPKKEDTAQSTSTEVKLTSGKAQNVTTPKDVKTGETIRVAEQVDSGCDLLLKMKINSQKRVLEEQHSLVLQKELELLMEELEEVNDMLQFEKSDSDIKPQNSIEYRFDFLIKELEQETDRLAEFGGDRGIKIAGELRGLISDISKKTQAKLPK